MRNPKTPGMRMKRYPIKKMLKDEDMKREMIVGVIMFCQGHEGRTPDKESAKQACGRVKNPQPPGAVGDWGSRRNGQLIGEKL